MTPAAELIRKWVLAQAGDEEDWLTQSLDRVASAYQERDLYIFMGLAPRRLGKADLALKADDLAAADAACPGVAYAPP